MLQGNEGLVPEVVFRRKDTEDILLHADVDTAFTGMYRARNRCEVLWTTEPMECSNR